ncbi:DUF4249 domain-containing protein [Puteibacter caeruleilacunae]|nr:DUF4249 domain-containing protein [Puteibacter caeruleilacunae]
MQIKYCLFILALAPIFTSCVEETEINTDNYVINSMFASDAPFIVQTSKTVSVFDAGTYYTEKGMEGKLYEDEKLLGELIFQEEKHLENSSTSIPEGYTLPNFAPKERKQYKIEFQHNGQTITASDVMPSKVDFKITKTATVREGDINTAKGLRCDLTFSDPPKEDNYYVISYNVTSYVDSQSDNVWTQSYGSMKSDDPLIEYQYYHQSNLATSSCFILSDKSFNGKNYTIPVDFYVGHDLGEVKSLNIYLLSVSEQYYKYVVSSVKQNNNNKDYYAEPTQAYNNINNGYGIFAAYNISKQSVEFERK